MCAILFFFSRIKVLKVNKIKSANTVLEHGITIISITFPFIFLDSIFNPFFKDAWERREDTESFFHHVSEPPSNILFELNPTIEKRPPAPLPKPNDLYHTTKSSTINRCISPDWGWWVGISTEINDINIYLMEFLLYKISIHSELTK